MHVPWVIYVHLMYLLMDMHMWHACGVFMIMIGDIIVKKENFEIVGCFTIFGTRVYKTSGMENQA